MWEPYFAIGLIVRVHRAVDEKVGHHEMAALAAVERGGLRVEAHHAVVGAQHQGAVGHAAGGILAIHVTQFVGREEIGGERHGLGVELGESVVGSYPQQARRVGDDAVGGVVGQTMAGVELLELQVVDVAGVGHFVDAAASRGKPHLSGGVLQDVANLEQAQRAVFRIVVVISVGVADELFGVEHHHSVATTCEDSPRARLHQFGDIAHERFLIQEPAELIGAVGLGKGEAQGPSVHRHPHALLVVAEQVEHLSQRQRRGVVGHIAVETAVDAHPLVACAYPGVALGVDAHREHVVVDTDAGLSQRVSPLKHIGAPHEVAHPDALVAGLTERAEEVHVVGRQAGSGIAPLHTRGHVGNHADTHVLLRYPDVSRAVDELAIEIVALDGRRTALGREVRLLTGGGVVDEETVASGRNPYLTVFSRFYHIGRDAALAQQLAVEDVEGIDFVSFPVDVIDVHVVVANIVVSGVVTVDRSLGHLDVVDSHAVGGGIKPIGGGVCDDKHLAVVYRCQSTDAVSRGQGGECGNVGLEPSLGVGMYDLSVGGGEIDVFSHLHSIGEGVPAVHAAQRVDCFFLFHIKALGGAYPHSVPAVGQDEPHIVAAQLSVALVILPAGNLPLVVFHLDATRVGIPEPGVAFGSEHTVAVVFLVVAIGDETYEPPLVGVVATVSFALEPDEEQAVGILRKPPQLVGEQQFVVAVFLMA